MPAAVRYAPLVAAAGDGVRIHAKDLEVYGGDEPSPNYSIEQEVEALGRFADSLGLDRFHLLGYSGGGFVSLAFAGMHADRLLSLALFEAASVPGRMTAEEEAYFSGLRTRLSGVAGADFMRVFTTAQVRPGAELAPPAGPPPAWMANRPAGLAAMMEGFSVYPFERSVLRSCRFPVFYGYGDQTGEQEELKVAVLSRLLPNLHVRRFEGIHHFVPPERIYNEEHVGELRRLWGSPS
jgi:pimeloyl-ACP methyl ester carboxylesterase